MEIISQNRVIINSTCILLFSERENKTKNCKKHFCLYTFSVLHFFFITDWRLYCNQYKVVVTCISICQSQQLGKKIHLGKFEKKRKKKTPV